MSHLSDALTQYSCGPSGHGFRDTGIRMSAAVSLTSGSSIPAPDREVILCETCGKTCGADVCAFCEQPVEIVDELIDPDGATVTLELCSVCHIDLIDGYDALGWRFMRISPCDEGHQQ